MCVCVCVEIKATGSDSPPLLSQHALAMSSIKSRQRHIDGQLERHIEKHTHTHTHLDSLVSLPASIEVLVTVRCVYALSAE